MAGGQNVYRSSIDVSFDFHHLRTTRMYRSSKDVTSIPYALPQLKITPKCCFTQRSKMLTENSMVAAFLTLSD